MHYSVSEASGYIKVNIHNKLKSEGNVGVRTVDGDAIDPKDYEAVDKVIQFKKGQEWADIQVKISDDDEWEPDQDFYIELYDPATGLRLSKKDTKTTVTIIDDDKPGMLSFEKRTIPSLRHDSTEE